MRLFDERDEEILTYLLTYDRHRYHGDHGYKHFGKHWLVSWVSYSELNVLGFLRQEVDMQQMCLICWLFGGFHACRKRERKTDYRRRYRVSRSRDSFFRCEATLARNCRPGDGTLSIAEARISSSHLNICWRRIWSCGFERCLKLKTSEVIWMLLMINCSKLGLDIYIVLWTQGQWTLPHELLFIFLKWIDSVDEDISKFQLRVSSFFYYFWGQCTLVIKII